MSGETVTVRGEGGDVFEMDVPFAATPAREHYDQAIAAGRLVIVTNATRADTEYGYKLVAEPEPLATEPSKDPDAVPDGTVAEVEAWVGDDIERADRALDVENAKTKPRSSLVDHLTAVIEG